jgi:serine/threonine protein kinase
VSRRSWGETPGALAVVISVEPHLPASHKNPQIPSGLDDVIAGALQKDPKKRYASVRELLRALEDFLPQTDLGLSATVREPPALPEPPTAPHRATPWLPQRPARSPRPRRR